MRHSTEVLVSLQAIALQPADSSILADNETLKRIATQLQAGQLALERKQWAAAEQHASVACRMNIPAIEPAMTLKCEALLGAGRFSEAVAESRGLTRGGDPYAAEVWTSGQG